MASINLFGVVKLTIVDIGGDVCIPIDVHCTPIDRSIYIYIYLEPICHLICFASKKKVFSNQNKGQMGSRYICHAERRQMTFWALIAPFVLRCGWEFNAQSYSTWRLYYPPAQIKNKEGEGRFWMFCIARMGAGTLPSRSYIDKGSGKQWSTQYSATVSCLFSLTFCRNILSSWMLTTSPNKHPDSSNIFQWINESW